jgi:hypothetical protein
MATTLHLFGKKNGMIEDLLGEVSELGISRSFWLRILPK